WAARTVGHLVKSTPGTYAEVEMILEIVSRTLSFVSLVTGPARATGATATRRAAAMAARQIFAVLIVLLFLTIYSAGWAPFTCLDCSILGKAAWGYGFRLQALGDSTKFDQFDPFDSLFPADFDANADFGDDVGDGTAIFFAAVVDDRAA